MKEITCPLCEKKTPDVTDRVMHHIFNHLNEKSPAGKLMKKIVSSIINMDDETMEERKDSVFNNMLIAVAKIIVNIEEKRAQKTHPGYEEC